jgi:hypothetical protein
VLFADGVTAEDRVNAEALRRYRTVILPSCSFLTEAQARALLTYLGSGGQVVVTGRLGENLPEDLHAELSGHPGVVRAEHGDVDGMLPGGRQVMGEGLADVAVNIHRLADGSAAVHLLNYAYDAQRDAVVPRRNVRLSVYLPGAPTSATLLTPDGKRVGLTLSAFDGRCSVELDELPLYSIVVLHDGALSLAGAGSGREE